MACCLTAPSHYLYQCWRIISWVLCHSPIGNSTENAHESYYCKKLKTTHLKSKPQPQRTMSYIPSHFFLNISIRLNILIMRWSRLLKYFLVGRQRLVNYTHLTHLPLDRMAATLQTIFSDAFPWIKCFVFWLKFHWSLFLSVQLTITQHWFR